MKRAMVQQLLGFPRGLQGGLLRNNTVRKLSSQNVAIQSFSRQKHPATLLLQTVVWGGLALGTSAVAWSVWHEKSEVFVPLHVGKSVRTPNEKLDGIDLSQIKHRIVERALEKLAVEQEVGLAMGVPVQMTRVLKMDSRIVTDGPTLNGVCISKTFPYVHWACRGINLDKPKPDVIFQAETAKPKEEKDEPLFPEPPKHLSAQMELEIEGAKVSHATITFTAQYDLQEGDYKDPLMTPTYSSYLASKPCVTLSNGVLRYEDRNGDEQTLRVW